MHFLDAPDVGHHDFACANRSPRHRLYVRPNFALLAGLVADHGPVSNPKSFCMVSWLLTL